MKKTLTSVLAVLLITFSFTSCSNNSSKNTADVVESTIATAAFYEIDEPFENVKVEYETLTVTNPSQPTTILTESGTSIEIPANAFVDEAGLPVTNPVDIQWREFHNAADIIASGIPMKVNDNGTEAWMQTAGMFEIKGFCKNAPIKVAPEKTLNVSFLSQQPGAYDAWVFNKKTGNWVNLGTNEAEEISVDKAALAQEITALETKTKKQPLKPVVNPKNHIRFTDLNLDCCPDLQSKKSIVLAKVNGDVKVPQNQSWVEKTLKKTDKEGIYELKLYGQAKIYTLEVKIPLQGADLKKANARYETMMAEYNANLSALKDKRKLTFQQGTFRRNLSVSSFDIYNYDILWKQDLVPIYADFDFGVMPDELKKALRVYLITGEGRTVIDFPQRDWEKFRFNPKADNKLIAVLPQNKLAFFTATDFVNAKEELIAAEGKDYLFKMQIEEGTVMSVEDLKKVIDKVSI